MDLNTRKRLYQACDPGEPLTPEDPRYVDIDSFGPPAPRGQRFVDRLARRIEASRRPLTQFVTAARGAGLTTELKRLARRLADPKGADLLPVVVDAAEVFDVAEPMDTSEVLLAVLAALEDAAAPALASLPRSNFLNELAQPFVEGQLPVSSTGIALLSALKQSPAARTSFRATVAPEASRFAGEIRKELILLHDRIRTIGHSGVVVIIDSTGRLGGTRSWVGDVEASTERVFVTDASLLELPFHAVYVTPPWLLLGRRRLELEVLPMIAVRTREGAPLASGREAVAEIVRRRIPGSNDFGRLFGRIESEERLARVADVSAGSPRLVVWLLRNLVVSTSAGPLSAVGFERILTSAIDELRRPLSLEDESLLASLGQSGPPADSVVGSSAAWLFGTGAVIPYSDGAVWFGTAPFVASLTRREVASG